jgi:hypothetical protein
VSLQLVENYEETENIIKGETIRVLVDYDLFGININGMTGFYVKRNERTSCHLIYIPATSEWCELKDDQFERVTPLYVTEEAEAFLSTIDSEN